LKKIAIDSIVPLFPMYLDLQKQTKKSFESMHACGVSFTTEDSLDYNQRPKKAVLTGKAEEKSE